MIEVPTNIRCLLWHHDWAFVGKGHEQRTCRRCPREEARIPVMYIGEGGEGVPGYGWVSQKRIEKTKSRHRHVAE